MSLSPTQAAQALGVSEATLRRWAKLYEEHFGPIATLEQGPGRPGRTYSDQALNQMQAARELLDQQRAATLEQAFRLLSEADGVPEAIQPLAPNPQDILVLEVQSLRQQLAMQQAMLEELHTKLDSVTKMLEPPKADTADLERRNRYLMGELVRRDKEKAEAVKRPWWWRWLRG
jgi:transposase-like protein